tara:strand:- start:1315 stop:1593 length:279 start_codon:yes stop_codon:yes gene_type:complete
MINLSDFVQTKMQREFFRGGVGRQIFCAVGKCGSVLDCRRAVEVAIYEGDQPVQVQYYCARCFDGADLDGLKNMLTDNGLRLETIDGRALYA